MAVNPFNLAVDQRAERKLLVTAIEWDNLVSGKYYVCTEEEPADWATNYTAYYTESQGAYTHVTGETAPTWAESTYYKTVDRAILGKRTPDSSIDYNVDSEDSTDILGQNYHDTNRTQPSQGFDVHPILGGDKFSEKINDIRRRNALTELSQFTVYVITLFVGNSTSGYDTERHSECAVEYESIGGDTVVNFPFTIFLSNKLTLGTVDKAKPDFTFTPDLSI